MNAAKTLKAAGAAGIHFTIDGDDLLLRAPAPPPPALVDLLSRHKASIVALLRSSGDSWWVDDQRGFFDEQAGITEPAPVLLRDGRRLYRFRAGNVPAAAMPGHARELRDEARWRGVVLVPDGCELIVVERWLSSMPPETLQAIEEHAGPVIAILREESRARSVSPGDVETSAELGIAAPTDFPDDFGKNGGA